MTGRYRRYIYIKKTTAAAWGEDDLVGTKAVGKEKTGNMNGFACQLVAGDSELDSKRE